MNIYKISQDKNVDYDTYNSAVVCAETSEEAQKMHPGFGGVDTWCKSEDVRVMLIGTTNHGRGVMLASFNAG